VKCPVLRLTPTKESVVNLNTALSIAHASPNGPDFDVAFEMVVNAIDAGAIECRWNSVEKHWEFWIGRDLAMCREESIFPH
jgi:hypothetical protein